MKPLIMSKTFWLSVITFVIVAVKGFWNIEIDPVIGKEIVEIDYSNLVIGITSALTIVARYFFTKVPIKGVLTTGEIKDSFDVEN